MSMPVSRLAVGGLRRCFRVLVALSAVLVVAGVGAAAASGQASGDAGVGDYPQASFSEQRLSDRSGVGVNVSNGNLLVDDEDLSIAGTGLDLEVGRGL